MAITTALNDLVTAAKVRMYELKSVMGNAHGEINGKQVSVRVSRVNTQTKDNQVKIAYKVNGKVVAAANIAEVLK